MAITEYNEDFDIEQWRSRLPGIIPPAQSIDTNTLHLLQGQAVSGPADILIVESLREAIAPPADFGHAVPCDVFCFGLGEPRHRYTSKVGLCSLEQVTTANGRIRLRMFRTCRFGSHRRTRHVSSNRMADRPGVMALTAEGCCQFEDCCQFKSRWRAGTSTATPIRRTIGRNPSREIR